MQNGPEMKNLEAPDLNLDQVMKEVEEDPTVKAMLEGNGAMDVVGK